MGVWLGPTVGKMNANGYSFSGQSEYQESSGNWEIALKTSGTFRFKAKVDAIDIFLVGGGQDGSNGVAVDYIYAHGGDGGDGGDYKTESNVSVSRATDYSIEIGSAGASPGASTGFGKTSSGGTKKTGGTGSYATIGGSLVDGTAGENGSKAFGESGALIGGDTIYGSSGGSGGSARSTDYGSRSAQSGGTGAGSGGSASAYGGGSVSNGAQATTPGSGGGGGGALVKQGGTPTPGRGGDGASGIIIIRNHRGD